MPRYIRPRKELEDMLYRQYTLIEQYYEQIVILTSENKWLADENVRLKQGLGHVQEGKPDHQKRKKPPRLKSK